MINANTPPAGGAITRSNSVQQQERPLAASPEKMSDLLRRYPEVDDAEKLELVDFLKAGHPDAIAMATYGAGLVAQVIKVKKDHPEHFASGWRMLLPWAGFLTLVLVMLLLARLI